MLKSGYDRRDFMEPEKTQGTVFNIQKFCTDDGPGIRTTVFLKGCHLRCAWCHNPEGLSRTPSLEYSAMNCAYCRHCEAVCPMGVHSFSHGEHHIDRSKCILCGECVKACENPAGCLSPSRKTPGYHRPGRRLLRQLCAAGQRDAGGDPEANPVQSLSIRLQVLHVRYT